MYEKIANHIGHNIEVASYGGKLEHLLNQPSEIVNVAVECMDCHEVIVDADNVVGVPFSPLADPFRCCDHEHEPHFCTHEDEVDGVFVQCTCEGM
jgi:hypothetical protein|tara:strand:+ start:99 stop:383 length:285 start_codon:yes stop_codon:yes gene_type:complete